MNQDILPFVFNSFPTVTGQASCICKIESHSYPFVSLNFRNDICYAFEEKKSHLLIFSYKSSSVHWHIFGSQKTINRTPQYSNKLVKELNEEALALEL